MATDKREVVLIGPLKPVIVKGLDAVCTVHQAVEAKDQRCVCRRASAMSAPSPAATRPAKSPASLMARFPKLEIVSSFGVGYDHVDVKWAAAHDIVVTNTPDVLTEEVADTALGLLLCTVREFPQAERYLRAGKWLERGYPLSQGDAAQPHRRHGRHGRHRPGDRAAARSLRCAGRLSHAQAAARCHYLHYPNLVDMARDVDMLMVIVPGGAGDGEYDQCRGARRARPGGHPDQHGARLGGR